MSVDPSPTDFLGIHIGSPSEHGNEMASIDKLPQEILLDICRYAEPRDIDSLIQVSRSVYTASALILKEHRALKTKHASITHIGMVSPENNLANLLKTIMMNPRVGQYIERLTIKGYERHWFPQSPGETVSTHRPRPEDTTLHRAYNDHDMALLKDAAPKCSIFSPPKSFDPRWLEDIERGDEGVLIALLLLHLPNLISFDLQDQGACTRRIFDILELNSELGGTCLLPKLKRLRFDHAKVEGQLGGCLEDINRLKHALALPSIASLEAKALERVQHDEIGAPVSAQSSNITSLSFKECGLSPKSMFELLEATKSLTNFSYVWPIASQGPQIWIDAPFDPFWIRGALLAFAKDSLCKLTLRAERSRACWMGCLKPFRVLKEVDTDHFMLFKPASERMSELTEVMPASIERLTLHVRIHSSHPILSTLLPL